MFRSNLRLGLGVLAVAAAVAAPLPRAHSDPGGNLAGEWSVSGRNSSGKYAGKVTIEKRGDNWVAFINLDYVSGFKGTAKFEGKLEGNTLVGKRWRTTGIVDLLGEIDRPSIPARYTLSNDGLKLDGRYGSARESFTRKAAPTNAKATLLVDSNRDGKLDASDRGAAAQNKSALVTLVPNQPSSVTTPLQVEVTEGKVTVKVSPEGALKVSASGELAVGKHDLKLEPVKDGEAEVQIVAGSTVVDRARVSVEKEKCYLILFGYMGAEENYLEGDLNRCRDNIVPKLKSAGYTVIEDGSGFDQGVIDKGLADPLAAKKVVIDWCTTGDDLTKYLARGGTKGFTWSSHGFMQPYPNCPDNELATFESRVWSCAAGAPSGQDRKHFVREWRGHWEKNAYQKMDFALNHSCATGGLGEDYGDKPWEYTDAATKSRAMAYFNNNLPPLEKLTLVTFDSLNGFFSFNQSYNGSAYFGMWDVKWSQLTGSIKP